MVGSFFAYTINPDELNYHKHLDVKVLYAICWAEATYIIYVLTTTNLFTQTVESRREDLKCLSFFNLQILSTLSQLHLAEVTEGFLDIFTINEKCVPTLGVKL